LTNEEKNKISMRKIALIKLKEFLLKENWFLI
jgi:inosine/xanthosine triphosphate pyrophosphatase family protein